MFLVKLTIVGVVITAVALMIKSGSAKNKSDPQIQPSQLSIPNLICEECRHLLHVDSDEPVCNTCGY